MRPAWQTPVIWFILFNLIAAPIAGRAAWHYMLRLESADRRSAAVALSLACAVGILAANVSVTRWARREGAPARGLQVMWLVTGGTFLLTIGFGLFSPVDLLIGLLRAG